MRDINIKIVIENGSPKLVCDDDEKIIGATWDNRGQRLVFTRDTTLKDYSMMLHFKVSDTWKDIDIGTDDTYEIINAFTKYNSVRFKLSFWEGTTRRFGTVNSLTFDYDDSPQTGEVPEEKVEQYLELLTAAKQYSADATTAAEKAQAAYAALAATDVGTLQAALELLNDSLVNNYGGTNLLPGTKDMSGAGSQGWTTTDTYRDFTIVHAARSDLGSETYFDLAWNSSIDPEPDTWYTLSFWAKGTGVINSYFYSDVISQGISSTGATHISADGRIITTVTSDWKRYWIRWKTLSTVGGTKKNVLPARVFGGNDIYICGVMFERGQYAHDWDYSPKDLKAEEYGLYVEGRGDTGYWHKLFTCKISGYSNTDINMQLSVQQLYNISNTSYPSTSGVLQLRARQGASGTLDYGKLDWISANNDVSNYLNRFAMNAVADSTGNYVELYIYNSNNNFGHKVSVIDKSTRNVNQSLMFIPGVKGTATSTLTALPINGTIVYSTLGYYLQSIVDMKAAIVALGGSI